MNRPGGPTAACNTRAPRDRSARRPLPRLRSAFPPRSAITLIEVLISMGVLTIGILGVAALFPVGAFYAQRAEVSDRADAAAAVALNDAVTRGLVDPENWVSYELVDGGSRPNPWGGAIRPGSRVNGTFTRPFAKDLRDRLAHATYRTWNTGGTNQVAAYQALNHHAGSLFFVDPFGVASGVSGPNQYTSAESLRTVPASTQSFAPITMLNRVWWSPWLSTAAINRVSVGRPSGNTVSGVAPVPLAMADELVAMSDDLAVELGDRADRPAQQRVLTYSGGPLSRQADLHYSYLVSVVPRTPEGRDALAYGGRGQAYDVTAVVFNRRPLNAYNPSDGFGGVETLARAERTCLGSVVSGGPSGGELRLFTRRQTQIDQFSNTLADNLPWKDLKAGQYVMVYGPDPNSTPARPLLYAQWYRVVALNDDDAKKVSGTVYLGPTLALRGPDWPWAASTRSQVEPGLSADYGGDPSVVQDDLRVLILDGAVGAYTRTMRLEAGTAWAD
ncbi:hypothetical protein [Posidoniimonas corsicana]|nr:hypothetical protein [Posidoniimonas corsicana]